MSKKDTFLKRQTSDQPGWAKGIENILIIGATVYVGYKLYQRYKADQFHKDENKSIDQSLNDLQKLAAQGVFPTITDTQFQTMAERLVGAMTGCGTDEDTIYQVMGLLQNDADFLKLINIFGLRGIMPCQLTHPVAYVQYLHDPNSFLGGLASWLQSELTTDEIDTVNYTLSQNGISYKF